MGSEMPAIIDPGDTILNSKKIIINTNRLPAAGRGINPITTPKSVATAFPPLNPARTG